MSTLVLFSLCYPSFGARGGRGSGSFGGGARSFSAPAAARSETTSGRSGSSSSTPSSRASYSPPVFRGYKYNRPGYSSTPILAGFAAGYTRTYITSSTFNNIHNNPNTYCNGVNVQCYKTSCQNAAAAWHSVMTQTTPRWPSCHAQTTSLGNATRQMTRSSSVWVANGHHLAMMMSRDSATNHTTVLAGSNCNW